MKLYIYLKEYGYDDVYGRSLDDEVAISPNTAGEQHLKPYVNMCECVTYLSHVTP